MSAELFLMIVAFIGLLSIGAICEAVGALVGFIRTRRAEHDC